MNNEEKKKYIIDAHRLYMELRPYDMCFSLDEMKVKEDEFWISYSTLFHRLFPSFLYKYRKFNKESIKCLIDGTAWFSHPSDFDDTVDSVTNNDIEDELREFEDHPEEITKRLAKVFITAFAAKLGVSINDKQIDEAFPLFNPDGSFNEIETKHYLEKVMPEYATEACLAKLKENTRAVVNEKTMESVKGFLMNYVDMNNTMRNEALVYSLAEESDNQAMWGLYADESRGFCIEYQFPKESFLGQRMLLNLFPIYYGDKPLIKFFDVLIKGLYLQNNINGISYEDYQNWFLSAYTKDKSYEWQKEWRITFDKRLGGNLQPFPFAKSIILGERMSIDNKEKLIAIAKAKGISVYERVVNKTGSRIVTNKLL